MDLVYLQTFRTVSKWKSFTKAAEQLGYAQSSVTTQVQKLEQEYGIVLFERWGRGIRLTSAGEQLLVYADQIMGLYEQSKEEIGLQQAGLISIGTTESLAAYFLPPFLQSFLHSHRQVNVSLHPANSNDILRDVKNGSHHIGLVLLPEFSDPELRCTYVRQEEVVLVAPLEHRLALHSHVELKDLEGESFIVTEEGCAYRGMMKKLLTDQGISFKMAYELVSMESIKQCVVYGLGIALLPRIAVQDDLDKGRLCVLAFSHPELIFYTQLITHPKKWLSQTAKHFIKMLLS